MADYNSMRDWLKGIDWTMECSDLTVDEMWIKFCSIIDRAINMFVSLGQCHVRRLWTAMCDDVRPVKRRDELLFCFSCDRRTLGQNIVRVYWCDKLFVIEWTMQNWPP